MAQGRGGLASERQTAIAFKTERGKVHTGAGAIIGQFLFDGEQVKGEVNSKVVDVLSAGERDASDRINRDRIPRQYQDAVKRYFSAVHKSMGNKQSEGKGEASDANSSSGEAEGGS